MKRFGKEPKPEPERKGMILSSGDGGYCLSRVATEPSVQLQSVGCGSLYGGQTVCHAFEKWDQLASASQI